MNNSKLIALILDGRSALNGSFSLSRSLIEKGHRVVYISADQRDKEYVESQGFPYLPFSSNNFKPPFPAPKKNDNPIKKRILGIRIRNAVMKHIYALGKTWIEEAKPNVVLLDMILPRFAIPFLEKKIPIININCTLSTIDHEGRPPVSSGLAPNNSNPLLNLRIRMVWAKIFFYQHYKELMIKLNLAMALGIRSPNWIGSRLKKLGARTKRTEYGIRLVAPEIFMGSRLIDFPASPRSGEQVKWYMGACVDPTRAHDDIDLGFLDKGKKLIYCAMGTHSKGYKYATNLYARLFEAMEQLTGCQLILQSQGVGDLSRYRNIPGNVIIVPKAPQLKLLDLASLFITHGGAGSIREGAYYGVPMIVFPCWHDQPGNAARVVYHHLGEKGSMRTITTKKLLSLIDKVMNDPDIRLCTQKMREEMRKDDNRPAIIQFIENYSS